MKLKQIQMVDFFFRSQDNCVTFCIMSHPSGSGQEVQMYDITNLDASQGFNRTFVTAMEEVSSDYVPREDSSSSAQTPASVLSLPYRVSSIAEFCFAMLEQVPGVREALLDSTSNS